MWERGRVSGQDHTLGVGEGEVGVLNGSPRHWLWMGEAGVVMMDPEPGCGGESPWLSWYSQTLVVGGELRRFSWQSHMLIVGGEVGVYMAVKDTCCGRESRWYSWQSMVAVGKRQGSDGSPRSWL